MNITVLIENTSAHGLPAEHGLSLFVRKDDCRFLFDLGQTRMLAENADRLGIDLNDADFAVLSHGHYDHGGGIEAFFKKNSHAPVWVSCDAFGRYYNAAEKYIGLADGPEASGRLIRVSGRTQIAPGLKLFPSQEVLMAEDTPISGLKMFRNGRMMPDDFRHEQYLLAEENGRRILFSGCSHRGILNIVRRFRPDVLVGGFHLNGMATDSALADIARKLDEFPTEYYTCHCTGTAQYEFMRRYMKHLHYISVGDSLDL